MLGSSACELSGASDVDFLDGSPGGDTGCTPNGTARRSIARVKGRFGRSASLGQRERMRVYCFTTALDIVSAQFLVSI